VKRAPLIVAAVAVLAVAAWWLWPRTSLAPRATSPTPPTRQADSPFADGTLFAFAADGDGLYQVTNAGGIAYFLADKGELGSKSEARDGPEKSAMDNYSKRKKGEWQRGQAREALASAFGVAGAGPLAGVLPGPSRFERERGGFPSSIAWSTARHAWASVGPPVMGLWLGDEVKKGEKESASSLFVFSQAYITILGGSKETLVGQSATDHQLRGGGSSSTGITVSDARVRFASMAIPPSGKWAVAGPEGKPLGVYRPRDTLVDGKPPAPLEQSEKVGRLVASDDAVAGLLPSNELAVWDAVTGKIRFRLNPPDALGFSILAFAGDGKRLFASAGDGAVHSWDAATGEVVATIKAGARHLSPSADGSRVLAGGETLAVWSVPGGERLATLAAGGRPAAVALSPDGRRAAALVGSKVLIWDLE